MGIEDERQRHAVTMGIAIVGALLFSSASRWSRRIPEPRPRQPLLRIVDGLVRIGLLLLYLYAISSNPDRPLLAYTARSTRDQRLRGRAALDVPNVRPRATLHPRCGTVLAGVMVVAPLLDWLAARLAALTALEDRG